MKIITKIMVICFLPFLFLKSTDGQNVFPTGAGTNVGINTSGPTVRLDLVQPAINNAYGLNDTTVLQNWGVCNIFTGIGTGFSLSIPSGAYNSFNGWGTGYNNTTGFRNTLMGHVAGWTNQTGFINTFLGDSAGYFTAGAGTHNGYGGSANTFVGSSCGVMNLDGTSNVFMGNQAGHENTTGSWNTIVGKDAGFFNTTANGGTFYGKHAGYGNTTGASNCYIGAHSGLVSADSYFNTGVGTNAFWSLTGGNTYENTSLGVNSGYFMTGGKYNLFLGGLSQNSTTYVNLNNAAAIGAYSVVTHDDQMILGGINPDNNNSVFCGIGLSNDIFGGGPQNQLEINADHLRAPNNTATGLRFRQVNSTSLNNASFSQNYNATTIQPWGKILTVNSTGDVGLTDAIGTLGLCRNLPLIPLPYLPDDAGMHLTDNLGPAPHRIYYEDQTDNSGWNSHDAIGLGYNCGVGLPGKLSVNQDNSATAPAIGNTVTGHFHNGDRTDVNAEKTGVYGISDGAANSDNDYNIGGDFEGLNSVSYNIGVRGRASRNYTLNSGVFNVGGYFDATGAPGFGVIYGSYSSANLGITSVGVYGEGNKASSANTGVKGVTLGGAAVNLGVAGVSSVAGVHLPGSFNVGVYGNVGIDHSCVSDNYAICGDLGIYCQNCTTTCAGLGRNWAGFFTGDVVSSTSFYTVSDSLLKDSLTSISSNFSNLSCVGILSKLHPMSYTFKQQEHLSTQLPRGRHFGIMAQELERNGLSNLVKQTVQFARYDSAGNQTYAPDTFKTVNLTELIPFCVGGLNEVASHQQQMDSIHTIDSLTISNLNDRLTHLESIVANCCNAGGRRTDTTGSNNNNQQQGDQQNTAKSINVELDNAQGIILNQNDPNPFGEHTTITYTIPDDVKEAKIVFFDNLGRILKTVVVGERGAGQLNVFAGNLSSGIYSYSLLADGKLVATKKMVKQD